MKAPDTAGRRLAGKENGLASPLGSNVLRREGTSKLRGDTPFVDDLPWEGVWVAGTVRADVPHAQLLGVHCDERFGCQPSL